GQAGEDHGPVRAVQRGFRARGGGGGEGFVGAQVQGGEVVQHNGHGQRRWRRTCSRKESRGSSMRRWETTAVAAERREVRNRFGSRLSASRRMRRAASPAATP